MYGTVLTLFILVCFWQRNVGGSYIDPVAFELITAVILLIEDVNIERHDRLGFIVLGVGDLQLPFQLIACVRLDHQVLIVTVVIRRITEHDHVRLRALFGKEVFRNIQNLELIEMIGGRHRPARSVPGGKITVFQQLVAHRFLSVILIECDIGKIARGTGADHIEMEFEVVLLFGKPVGGKDIGQFVFIGNFGFPFGQFGKSALRFFH